jgi:hypothetical protein
MEGLASLVETLCIRGQIPETSLVHLLQHPDSLISGKAALGEWISEPQGKVRESVYDAWRQAILEISADEFWLGQVLSKDAPLALEWLRQNFVKKSISYDLVSTIREALKSLGTEARKELLRLVPADTSRPEIIVLLIGSSLELYGALLADASKATLHLLPLRGFKYDEIGEEEWNEEEWIAKATMAFDAGYSGEEISSAIFSLGTSWSGRESAMWARWLARYERLCSNSDSRIRKAGQIGRDRMKKEYDLALAEERREAIEGR